MESMVCIASHEGGPEGERKEVGGSNLRDGGDRGGEETVRFWKRRKYVFGERHMVDEDESCGVE